MPRRRCREADGSVERWLGCRLADGVPRGGWGAERRMSRRREAALSRMETTHRLLLLRDAPDRCTAGGNYPYGMLVCNFYGRI